MTVISVAVILVGSLVFGLLVLTKNQEAVMSARENVDQIEQLLPPRSPGMLEERNNPTLSVLEIDGTDFVGILEYITSGQKLPVYAHWSNSPFSPRPALFSGSAYDGSLIIGGRNQVGQFDFCERLDIGDEFIFTDVQGQEFRYSVVKIQHASKIVPDQDDRFDLTLFTKIAVSTNVLIRCKLS